MPVGVLVRVRLGVGDIGGDEDFQVNGESLFVGELEIAVPANPAPGVLFSISATPIYAGKKEALRPVHDAVLAILATLGEYEAAPKKDYISYRRKKQFLMVGPKTATAVELGFGAKALSGDARLKEMPPNSMCKFTTRLSSPAEVDATVRQWIVQSFDEAG